MGKVFFRSLFVGWQKADQRLQKNLAKREERNLVRKKLNRESHVQQNLARQKEQEKPVEFEKARKMET